MTKTADISVDKGNTKFGTWTGTIVYNVELNDIITFTIEGTEYQAVDGMTWREWANSDYDQNQFGIVTGTESVSASGNGWSPALDDVKVQASDVIIAGAAYTRKF